MVRRCPWCGDADLELKERYPNAKLEILKEQYALCPKCGYKAELKEAMKK